MRGGSGHLALLGVFGVFIAGEAAADPGPSPRFTPPSGLYRKKQGGGVGGSDPPPFENKVGGVWAPPTLGVVTFDGLIEN